MSAKPTSATIDASALKSSLSTLAPVLDAFNHRHKNAHHSSHWWSHFNIIRRSVKKLLSSPSHRDVLLPRLQWMRDHIVPRAYVPFTQLVADPQHAPMGVLLMGVLARISTILTDVLPEEATSTPAPVPEKKSSEMRADKGVAISRDSIPQTSETRKNERVVVSRDGYAKPKASKPSKGAETDGFAQLFADEPSMSDKKKGKKPTLDSETAAPPKKKRKKTKTQGDDFSSIFGSL